MSFIDTSSGTPVYNMPSVTLGKNSYNVPSNPALDRQKFSGDISGNTAAVSNYIMQHQKNAYDLELWNLTNKYNSPVEQMKRYEEAGLNPNLIYSQQNTAGVPSSSSVVPTKATNFRAQNRIDTMNSLANTLRSTVNVMQGIRDVYQFARYGETYLEQQNRIAQQQANALEVANSWKAPQAAALAWYYGFGLPYNSPYYFNVKNNLANQGATLKLIGANTEQSKMQSKLIGVQLPYWIASTLATYENMKKVPWEIANFRSMIANRAADTANKEYFLNHIYPYQSVNLGANLLNSLQGFKMNKFRYDMLGSQNPWLNLNVGNKAWNDVLRFGAGMLGNYYQNLPIWHPDQAGQYLTGGMFGF